MTALITVDDIKEYKGITGNLNFEKDLLPHILEAQEFDVAPMLGQSFWLAIQDDFIASPSLSDYSDLVNGCRYTDTSGDAFENPGLKSVIIYHAYARYLNGSNSHSTPYGMVQKLNNHSEPLSEKAINRLVEQARSGAMVYQNRVLCYLREKSNDYPLFKCSNPKVFRHGFRAKRIG